jgi:hypothetical protein
MKRLSTRKRAAEVQAIIAEHYEPMRRDRCYLWVYRHHIYPKLGIGITTFYKYLHAQIDPEPDRPAADPRQLELFPDFKHTNDETNS